ncbi:MULTISPECIES: hypothetical protein [Rhizobium]|uniref:hypothetical protein n=1 Tax=Rhizobium TaxID=379 RepID=UPI001C917A17|nr:MULTISPECIES: hypothetical protein [Rhizobium]MBY3173132.1 hypothetical protein [Rhizobium leguminosarum]MBY3366490.1 hypothetical protein [Rhizobium laguerreae]
MRIMPPLLVSAIATAAALNGSSLAADLVEPGGTAAATHQATFAKDEYGWRLFFFLNQQARADKAGVPDDSKASFAQYDANQPVVWETWALATGGELVFDGDGDASEVFKSPATKPAAWDELARPEKQKVLAPSLKSSPLITLQPGTLSNLAAATLQAELTPHPSIAGMDETRMNRITYDTIRDKGLYSLEGLDRAYAAADAAGASMIVDFDQGAKEIKARWVRIDQPNECNPDGTDLEAAKQRYHWRTLTATDATGQPDVQTWGLVSLHIITKDLPNWFWVDFGHIDCVDVPPGVGQPVAPVDTTTRGPNAPSGENGVRNETRGTKWENYLMHGTQVAFVDPAGRETILSNPVIEQPNQNSSCMTCHARASIAPQSSNLPPGPSIPGFASKMSSISPGVSFSDVGIPDPVFEEGGQRYRQIDFLWSIPFRAFSETGK